MLKRKLLLVYGLSTSTWHSNIQVDLHSGVEMSWAHKDVIQTLFKDDPRRHTFPDFLERNFVGLILHTAETWIAYAWMTTPSTGAPPHLPEWVSDTCEFWIFYCRTREAFRGRGFYKHALRALINRAGQEQNVAIVNIDTKPTNVQSRRAIISTGFQPKGIMTTYQVEIPILGQLTLGSWQMDSVHPPFAP